MYGVGPSYIVYDNGTVALAPVVELFGWHVMSGFCCRANAWTRAAPTS